jgi:hypothetical protein
LPEREESRAITLFAVPVALSKGRLCKNLRRAGNFGSAGIKARRFELP